MLHVRGGYPRSRRGTSPFRRLSAEAPQPASTPFAPMHARHARETAPLSPYSPQSSALAGMMAFSSCEHDAVPCVRPCVAMPYSVQNLPENVTQPPPMDSFVKRGSVKAESAHRLLGPHVQRHPAEAHAGPRRKLLVAVLAEHVAGDGLVVNAGLPGKGAEKPRGIKARACTEDSSSRKAETQGKLPRDNVAGVRDVDENAVKAGCLDLLPRNCGRRER